MGWAERIQRRGTRPRCRRAGRSGTRRLAAGVLAGSGGYSDAFPPKDAARSVYLVRERKDLLREIVQVSRICKHTSLFFRIV